MSADHPWRQSGGGLLVDVRLTPKSSRDGIDGIEQLADGRCVLKARVRAVPEKGAANAALTKLVAKSVGLPKSAVDLESGSTSRIKTLRLSGDADQLSATLISICAE